MISSGSLLVARGQTQPSGADRVPRADARSHPAASVFLRGARSAPLPQVWPRATRRRREITALEPCGSLLALLLQFAARSIPLLACLVTALCISRIAHAHPSTDTHQARDNRVRSEDPRRPSASLPRLRAARASLKSTYKTCAREHSLGGDRAAGGGTTNHIYSDAERPRTRECQRREAPPFTRGSPRLPWQFNGKELDEVEAHRRQ
jgi:hypothetical protein